MLQQRGCSPGPGRPHPPSGGEGSQKKVKVQPSQSQGVVSIPGGTEGGEHFLALTAPPPPQHLPSKARGGMADSPRNPPPGVRGSAGARPRGPDFPLAAGHPPPWEHWGQHSSHLPLRPPWANPPCPTLLALGGTGPTHPPTAAVPLGGGHSASMGVWGRGQGRPPHTRTVTSISQSHGTRPSQPSRAGSTRSSRAQHRAGPGQQHEAGKNHQLKGRKSPPRPADVFD